MKILRIHYFLIFHITFQGSHYGFILSYLCFLNNNTIIRVKKLLSTETNLITSICIFFCLMLYLHKYSDNYLCSFLSIFLPVFLFIFLFLSFFPSFFLFFLVFFLKSSHNSCHFSRKRKGRSLQHTNEAVCWQKVFEDEYTKAKSIGKRKQTNCIYFFQNSFRQCYGGVKINTTLFSC